MKAISELKDILSEHLIWNKARLDCFARMLLALFAVKTTSLSEIAVAFSSNVDISSRYKRLQRFSRYLQIDYSAIARWLFTFFFAKTDTVYLLIDRTNWYWGKQKINVFTLAVTYEGLAISIFWQF